MDADSDAHVLVAALVVDTTTVKFAEMDARMLEIELTELNELELDDKDDKIVDKELDTLVDIQDTKLADTAEYELAKLEREYEDSKDICVDRELREYDDNTLDTKLNEEMDVDEFEELCDEIEDTRALLELVHVLDKARISNAVKLDNTELREDVIATED